MRKHISRKQRQDADAHLERLSQHALGLSEEKLEEINQKFKKEEEFFLSLQQKFNACLKSGVIKKRDKIAREIVSINGNIINLLDIFSIETQELFSETILAPELIEIQIFNLKFIFFVIQSYINSDHDENLLRILLNSLRIQSFSELFVAIGRDTHGFMFNIYIHEKLASQEQLNIASTTYKNICFLVRTKIPRLETEFNKMVPQFIKQNQEFASFLFALIRKSRTQTEIIEDEQPDEKSYAEVDGKHEEVLASPSTASNSAAFFSDAVSSPSAASSEEATDLFTEAEEADNASSESLVV